MSVAGTHRSQTRELAMKRITTNDPETHSTDVIAQNIEHLKMLFPEAFTEGKVDFEVLKPSSRFT